MLPKKVPTSDGVDIDSFGLPTFINVNVSTDFILFLGRYVGRDQWLSVKNSA